MLNPVTDKNRDIIQELETRSQSIKAYGQDYVMKGYTAKRMYFQFEKDGRPFYRFRSDHTRAGKPYVYIYNADGLHDYHYFPSEKKAYRCPTDGAWNESNYEKAREGHFNYDGAVVIGEDIINEKECYLLKHKYQVIAVWKEKGMKLATMKDVQSKSEAMYYKNIDFNIKDEIFEIPPEVKIIQKETSFFE
jgi:hypothetical protein